MILPEQSHAPWRLDPFTRRQWLGLRLGETYLDSNTHRCLHSRIYVLSNVTTPGIKYIKLSILN